MIGRHRWSDKKMLAATMFMMQGWNPNLPQRKSTSPGSCRWSGPRGHRLSPKETGQVPGQQNIRYRCYSLKRFTEAIAKTAFSGVAASGVPSGDARRGAS